MPSLCFAGFDIGVLPGAPCKWCKELIIATLAYSLGTFLGQWAALNEHELLAVKHNLRF